MNSSRLNSFNTSSKMLEKAARTYIDINNIAIGTGTTEIIYSDIKNAGYINRVVDPISNNECINSRVYVTNIDGNYVYNGALVCDNYMDVNSYNLVSNGDFTNGTTGWSGIDSVVDGIAEKTATSQYGMISFSHSNYLTLRNHIIYMCGSIKTDSTNVKLTISDSITNTSTSSIADNQFHFLSAIKTISDTSPGVYSRIQDNRSSGWTKFYVDNIYTFDLTAIYGLGNEISKTQMDNIMSNMY